MLGKFSMLTRYIMFYSWSIVNTATKKFVPEPFPPDVDWAVTSDNACNPAARRHHTLTETVRRPVTAFTGEQQRKQ